MKFIKWLIKVVNSRFFQLLICFILELLFILIPTLLLSINFSIVYYIILVNFVFVVYIINKKKNLTFKLAWIIVLCVLPFVGFVLYLIFADKRVPHRLTGCPQEFEEGLDLIENDTYNIDKIRDKRLRNQFAYIKNNSSYPCFTNTSCKYFASGKECFDSIFEKVGKAEKFIFIEFFIVRDGQIFNKLLNLLEKKIKDGVSVYFLLDDLGCLPYDSTTTIKRLKNIGANVAAFSKITFPTIFKTSYRDHRKIFDIDNKYVYTGGINISDEYAGFTKPHGEWCDSAVLLTGKAVSSYTLMFIQFFNYSSNTILNASDFIIPHSKFLSRSYILPFSDSPTDDENIGRNVQLNIINNASKYVFICTPYLVIDDEIENALLIKAKTGVRVCIVVPHIPDKKTVFMATRSHYESLVKNGVEIYEYTPGFMHSKLIVSDDDIALEGSINLDFRSHFLQFESGVLIGKDPSIRQMKKDYLNILSKSERITIETVNNTKFFTKLLRAIVNVFSPIF